MEGKIENIIDIAAAFSCRLCKKIALEPLQNQCCTIIICDTCHGPTCYCCKKPCIYKKSPFLTHLYKCITIKCPYKCRAQLTLTMMKNHIAVCPQATMQCPLCKDKNIKTSQFHLHMGGKHEQECSRILIQFHKDNSGIGIEREEMKIAPFRVGINGVPRICKNGRLVCSGDLGLTTTNKQSFFSSTTTIKLYCSLESGSCNKCMKMDKERLNLSYNCLLNFQGRISFFSIQKKKFGCGIVIKIKGKNVVCNSDNSCAACEATLHLITRGLYRELLTFN